MDPRQPNKVKNIKLINNRGAWSSMPNTAVRAEP